MTKRRKSANDSLFPFKRAYNSHFFENSPVNLTAHTRIDKNRRDFFQKINAISQNIFPFPLDKEEKSFYTVGEYEKGLSGFFTLFVQSSSHKTVRDGIIP